MTKEELEKAGQFLAEFDEADETSVSYRQTLDYRSKVISLRALTGKLLGELAAKEAGEGMEKEYATYSPNAKAHVKLKIMDHGDEEYDIRFAKEFADNYLVQSVEGGIHKDAEAAGVWRWVGEWEYMEGYPKTREQVEQMIKEKEEQ